MPKFKRPTLSLRKGADGSSVTFHATNKAGQDSTFDTTDFDRHRTQIMRELVVDYWRRINGVPKLHNTSGVNQ